MVTILDSIIERKRIEAEVLKRAGIKIRYPESHQHSLIQNLKITETMAIISEFKRASPSKGDINLTLNPQEQAKLYENAGAAAISVLTDEEGFKGTFNDLLEVRKAVDIPVLCKDFIVDKIQIDFARAHGANVILLIASVLPQAELFELYGYAAGHGLECLVEIHDERDLEKALAINASLIGVNNRDLKTFQVNIETTERLGPLVKEAGALLISESGIKSKEDVLRASAAGANGILVGETLMTSRDIQQSFMDFKVPVGG
ncbi:MAG TPA: indole-3-glycerol phosphate synthase TrpC [Bacillus bacterium]|nr:indole-3-glycerol phosphate synthase TrpC [Bacillus sp. (in: firmicutes)]